MMELCVPGIIYVRERRADSIWETWPAFLVTKSSYFASHFGGTESTLRRFGGCMGDLLVLLFVSADDDMLADVGSRHWWGLKLVVEHCNGQKVLLVCC